MGLLYSVFRSDRNWRGLNIKQPDTNLVPTESPDLQDIDFFARTISKRLGGTRYNPTVLPGSSLFFEANRTDGAQPRVEIEARTAYDFGLEFTIEFGLNFSRPTTDATGNSVPYTQTGYPLAKDTAWNFAWSAPAFTNQIQFAAHNGTTVNSVSTPVTFSFQPNRDYFISLSRTDTLLSLYVDGALMATGTAPTGVAFITNTARVSIGANVQSQIPFGVLNARMGEVRFWSDQRTATEIQENANRELFNDQRDASLVGYWPLNEGSGQVAQDAAAGDNDGYLRPAAPQWVSGLMGGSNALLATSTAGGDYAVRFDGQSTWFQVQEDLQQALQALRNTDIWSVQFRAQIHSTATNQYLLSYGLSPRTYSTFTSQPEVLEISTVASGAAVHLAAWFGGYAGSASTGFTLTGALAIQPSGIYNLSATRLSSTIGFAVGTAGSDYTRATAAFTFSPPLIPWTMPAIFGGRSGPVTSTAAGGTATNTPYIVVATTGFARYSLDEVRFWRSSVNGIERQETELPDPQTRNEMLGYFRFREGTGFTGYDSALYGLTGLLEPRVGAPSYETGVVTPLVGPPVQGASYYQRLNLETTPGARANRYIIVNSGNDLWQFQQGVQRNLKTGLSAGFKSSFDAHDNLLLWGNGVDRNQKFDGVRVENNGIEAPTGSVTILTAGASGRFAHGGGIQGGASLMSAFSTDRTEQVRTWNGALMQIGNPSVGYTVGFYTPPTSTNKTFGQPQGIVVTQGGVPWDWRMNYSRTDSPRGRTQVRIYGDIWQMPPELLDNTGYLEGYFLQIENNAWTQATGYTTRIVASTPFSYGPNSPAGRRWLDVAIDPARPLTDHATITLGSLLITSTLAAFNFTTPVTAVNFATVSTTYQFPNSELGLNGCYKWGYTFYNPRTGTESELSPLSAAYTASTNGGAYLTNVQVSSDPQTGARRIYRTQGAATITEIDDSAVFFQGEFADNLGTVYFDRTFDTALGELNEDLKGVAPNAGIQVVFKDRAFYAGIVETPNSVYFSQPSKPEEVPAENFLDLDTGDGDSITGIGKMADELLIFKRTSTWQVVGVDQIGGNLAVRKLESNIGCISHHTIVFVENRLYWCSDRGVYSYDGSQFQYHSEALEPFFRFLNPDLLRGSVAVNRRLYNCYVLSIPDQNASENNRTIVYDYVTGVWTQWSRHASHWVKALSFAGLDQVFYADYRGFLTEIDTSTFNELGLEADYPSTMLIGTVNAVTSNYRFTALGTPGFPTTGSGLKGAQIYFQRAGVDLGTDVIVENTGGATPTVRLRSGTVSIQAGDVFHIAPIRAYYKFPFLDLEVPEQPKKFEFVHVDQTLGSTGTLDVIATYQRTAQATKTASIAISAVTTRSHLRGRGYHIQLTVQNYVPNVSFHVRNVSVEGQVDVVR